MSSNEDIAEKVRAVAELLGISPERLLAAATLPDGSEDGEVDETPPARIVYPNIKFKGYKYREYPKAFYRGVVRDVEEPYVKIEKDGTQIKMIKVLPDQFVWELKEVKSKAEEVGITRDWFPTLALAKADAIAQKDKPKKENFRLKPAPVVENDADGEDDPYAEDVVETPAQKRARLRREKKKHRKAA